MLNLYGHLLFLVSNLFTDLFPIFSDSIFYTLIVGLMYLIMKHLVDRYNIYFAYGPSKIDKDIHATAVNFVIVAVIFMQVAIVFFIVLRTSKYFMRL